MPERVAYQGDPGAFSEEAVRLVFPEDEPVPRRTLRAVFDALSGREARFGMVPVENSQAGSINETYDLLEARGTWIVGEAEVAVAHALLALPGTRVEDVRVVSSHPQALAQCQEFLAGLDAEVVAVFDTAGAARRIADERRSGEAAVASRRAAELYGLEVLATGIQTDPGNRTRFAAIALDPQPLGEPDKTSLSFATRDVPGALIHCLQAFADRGLNLSKLESRPLGGGRAWRYRFFLDVEAGLEDPALRAALEDLERDAAVVRVLGTYPRWKP
jgi:prephenate dehydratase